MRIARKKDRKLRFSLLYRLYNLIPFCKKTKLKRLLNNEWIYKRIAFEHSFLAFPYSTHPFYLNAVTFISKYVEKGDNVLDVGCKHGHIAALLAEKTGVKITAIDIDKDAIDKAKELFPLSEVDFIVADAYDFFQNNKNEKHKVILLSNVLEHMDEPESFLRLVKGKAELLYIDLPDFDATFHNVFRKELELKHLYEDDDHVFEFTREEFDELVDKNGYEIVASDFRYGYQKYILRSI